MKHSFEIISDNALLRCIGGYSNVVIVIGNNIATATGTGAHAYTTGRPSGFAYVNGHFYFYH